MACDLQRLFGESAAATPTTEDESFVFTTGTLPAAPPRLFTDGLYIKKTAHAYEYGYEVDLLRFHARKETYRLLGLLFLSVVFDPEPKAVSLELTHPASDIKHFLIDNELAPAEELSSGYYSRPHAFIYWPKGMDKHPFDPCADPVNLPRFGLTNLEDFLYTEEHRRARDTVRCFGRDRGNALFAELLLNAGRPESACDEYELEGEAGFRGVGVGSAEVSLYLPGHIAWDDREWPTDSGGARRRV
jgi:hypothetical protein